MAAVKIRTTDWTAGELSPTLGGRVDVDKYGHGAARIENFTITTGGGLRRRPGTRYRGTAAGRARLIPFIFSEGEAFVLELCEGTLRFYRSAGRVESPVGTPVQVAHPYLRAELPAVKWTQSADVLLLVHPNHPPARLDRLLADGTLWRYRVIGFDVPPSLEFGLRGTQVAATMTPSAVSGTVTLTASAPTFLTQDTFRLFRVLGGASVGASAQITVVTDPTHATAVVSEPFASTAPIAAGQWLLGGSPIGDLTPTASSPVGATTTLTANSDAFRPGDVGKFVHVHGGTYEITVITDAQHVQAIIRSVAVAVTLAPAGAWTLEEPAWSADNGYPTAVAFAESRLWYFGTRRQPLTAWGSKSGDFFNFALGTLADDALEFTLNSDQVNAIRWAVSYGRGLLVGTDGDEWAIDAGEGQSLTPETLAQAVKPVTAYGSTGIVPPVKIGNVVLFATRSRRKLRELAPDPNAISTSAYVAQDMTLLAEHLTTPARILTVKQGRRFVDLAWQREPHQAVWAVREDGTLLSFAYIREQNVTGWARQVLDNLYPSSESMDDDGAQVPSITGGRVESVAVIPHADGDRDQVWLSVRREVGGAVVRHVEALEEQGTVFADGFVLDAAVTVDGQVYGVTLTMSAPTGLDVTFTSSAPYFTPAMVGSEIRYVLGSARARITAYISPTAVTADVLESFVAVFPTVPAGLWGIAVFEVGGLAHLVTRQVQIVGDGAVYPVQTVAAPGQVTLGYAAMKVEVGLGYASRLQTLKPEVAGLGTIQGAQKRQARIILRVYKSSGFTLNGTVQPFRRGEDHLGTGPAPLSADIDLANLGWDTAGQIEVEQTQPLPLTLLGLFTAMATAD